MMALSIARMAQLHRRTADDEQNGLVHRRGRAGFGHRRWHGPGGLSGMEHRQVHGRPNVMLTPRVIVTPSPSLSPTRTPIARCGPGYCLVITPSPAANSAAGSILLGVRLDQTYAGGM